MKNGSVRLHYVERGWDSPSNLTPLVYDHAGFGTAEVFIPEMKALSPRRCVSCSLRGRGNSDVPEAGYSFNENVSDIHAVVNHLSFDRICVMGWSIGVTYSIAFAAQHPELVSGLVLLDYPARYPKFSAGWAERWVIRAIGKGQPRPDEGIARAGTRVQRDSPLGQAGRDKILHSSNRRRCRGSPAQTRTRRKVQTTLPKLGSRHLS
ncbi:MAG TPA: alpha/beta hydrolase [Candidatus Bathyarchaeia archaeon]|nr:alpha/beta hydrolase [Candidatus Bathyarchaeia archaeon]